jgi:hypothetical protein
MLTKIIALILLFFVFVFFLYSLRGFDIMSLNQLPIYFLVLAIIGIWFLVKIIRRR